VSGRVTGPDGPGAFLAMTLVPPTGTDFQSEGVAEAARGATDATGAFTFLGVPAGQYVLKIRMYPRALTPPATTTMTSAPNADGTVNVTLYAGAGGAAPARGA